MTPQPASLPSRWLSVVVAVVVGPVLSLRAETSDIVIYGGTAAGVVAAIQADRMGRSVVLLEPGRHLGGMTTGGLGATDLGDKHSLGGIAREFYRNVFDHYAKPAAWRAETRDAYLPRHPLIFTEAMKAQWFFEPHVAENILRGMLAATKVKVVLDAKLDRASGVAKDGQRLTAIRTLDGRVYDGKVFIDATYEGDLMAAAGVSYVVGREANSQYGETLNGIRFLDPGRARHVDPYVRAGDPSSGLLPRIDPGPPGEEGAGDHRVQAYNFRMCLTDDPANRAVVTKPDGYDPLQYETVLRHLLAHPQARLGEILFTLVPMPNRKTDSNNKNLFSTDFVGASHAWPEASYEERARIWQAHRTYQQGLLWFLANDPRVPETLRAEVAEWGLARDEFADNGNWPYQLYVREARRMVADYVVTEHDTVGRHRAPDPVALASYGMDSHLVSLFVDDQHRLRLEGAFFKSVKPYPVSYRAVVPKKSECTNLLVPVCVSASHAAYGSMRMEPVFMMLGQAAATAAALAVQSPSAVQDVPYESLRDHLRRDGMVLDAPAPAEKPSASPAALEKADPDSPAAAAIENLAARGVLADKEYWLMNVKPKATCDGEMVGVVLIKSASLFEPVDNLDAAIDVLIKNSVITAPEYWQERARAGKVCHGVQVGNIFQALAKRLPQ